MRKIIFTGTCAISISLHTSGTHVNMSLGNSVREQETAEFWENNESVSENGF